MQLEEERKRVIRDEKTGLLERMSLKRWPNGWSSLYLMNVFGDETHQRMMVYSSVTDVSNLLLCGHPAKTQLVTDSNCSSLGLITKWKHLILPDENEGSTSCPNDRVLIQTPSFQSCSRSLISQSITALTLRDMNRSVPKATCAEMSSQRKSVSFRRSGKAPSRVAGQQHSHRKHLFVKRRLWEGAAMSNGNTHPTENCDGGMSVVNTSRCLCEWVETKSVVWTRQSVRLHCKPSERVLFYH